MKLLFKQRAFSWFDSYDVYDEAGNTVYVVKGQLAWGNCLKIFDRNEIEVATVQQKLFSSSLPASPSTTRAGTFRVTILNGIMRSTTKPETAKP